MVSVDVKHHVYLLYASVSLITAHSAQASRPVNNTKPSRSNRDETLIFTRLPGPDEPDVYVRASALHVLLPQS